MRRPALGGALLWLASCSPAAVPWRGAQPAQWPEMREELARLRDSRPREPWSAGLRATMRSPRGGRVLDARGGIAVAPGRGLRMILVAGAGGTLLDAWVTRDRWRIAVPPAGLIRRGGAEDPRELPVGFLRWWFFRPLEGRLFAASRATPSTTPPEDVFLLRDDDGAAIELRAGRCLRASRRLRFRTERVDECPAEGTARAGSRVRYEDESSGLTVELELEASGRAPEDDAFRDPDAPGGAG
jgi:hypothetical protein